MPTSQPVSAGSRESEIGGQAPAACTIIARNHLSYARIVGRSYLEHEPNGRFYVLVVDGVPEGVSVGSGVRVIRPEQLLIPGLREMCFTHGISELCAALKPAFLSLLIDEYGEHRVIYVDPDMLILQPLDALKEALSSASIVLTPRLLDPLPRDGLKPTEQDVLLAGAYTPGFIAVKKSDQTERLLGWWSARLEDSSKRNNGQGRFVDQRWIDLVPSLFRSTAILRDETYNVAYWNLHARAIGRGSGPRHNVGREQVGFAGSGLRHHVSGSGERFLVNGKPLTFFHFSGFDPSDRSAFSKLQSRTAVTEGTALAELLDWYARLHQENEYPICSAWPDGYSTFADGTVIDPEMRRLYAELSPEERASFGDPFEARGEASFLRWVTELREAAELQAAADLHAATAPPPRDRVLSPFLESLYRLRPDAAARFPDVPGRDSQAFYAWAQEHASREMRFDPRLVDDPNAPPIGGPPVVGRAVAVARRVARRVTPPWARAHLIDVYLGMYRRGVTMPRVHHGELSPLLKSLYEARPDVAAAFPDVNGRDRGGFLAWARACAPREMGVDPRLVDDPNAPPIGGASAPADAAAPADVGAAAASSDAPVAAPTVPLGVNVSGYLRNETGLGAVARGYVAALRSLGVPTVLNDVSELSPNRSEDPTFTEFDLTNPYGVNLMCANVDQALAFQARVGEGYFRDKYNIGVWFWELPRFPEVWRDRFAHYDELWAATTFIANTLAPISPIPVVRMPPSLATRSYGSVGFRARGRQRLGVSPDDFVYLFVFDFRSIFQRKNPLMLIEAFTTAFAPGEAARLVIKCVNGHTMPAELALMRAQAEGHPISIYDEYWSAQDVRDLMAACDVYASLHRSEGLGLTMAEAMAHGKPVIATNWSGNTDFMTAWNSFPVRYDLVELAEDYGPYLAGQTWANPSVAHAAELMRHVFEDREAARSVGEAGKRDLFANFSRQQVANAIRTRLATLEARHPRRVRAWSMAAALSTNRGDGLQGSVGQVQQVLAATNARIANLEWAGGAAETSFADLAEVVEAQALALERLAAPIGQVADRPEPRAKQDAD